MAWFHGRDHVNTLLLIGSLCRKEGVVETPSDWEDRLTRWQNELELFERLDEAPWVTLARAEAETGVSRSALRSWYRNGEIQSRLVDGPNGPQGLGQLDAGTQRA